MQHSAKYIIHADIRASGVVERSDVVGAIFGQTEGLLGEDMDLRDLQEASKVGRIDVAIESEGGRSFGTIKIASGLDRAETAVLAAALETIERVGPCRSTCEIVKIEDARAAKRRQIVDRATELLAEFEAETLTSDRLVDEVRERLRESEISEFNGLPAGPRVASSDAIVVVEGRADVRQLLSHGIRNAIAVEGTDIPDEVAKLTHERTTTAFLDGDRGGDLVLRELTQVGDVDYVAFAPSGRSVEDLDRAAIMGALRKKVPYEQIDDQDTPREAFAPTDGGTVDRETPGTAATPDGQPSLEGQEAVEPPTGDVTSPAPETAPSEETNAVAGQDSEESPTEGGETPCTLAGHVEAVIESGSGSVRLLDSTLGSLDERPADDVVAAIEDAEESIQAVIYDGVATQRVLDVCTQHGIEQLIAEARGNYVKQPTTVRVHTGEEILAQD